MSGGGVDIFYIYRVDFSLESLNVTKASQVSDDIFKLPSTLLHSFRETYDHIPQFLGTARAIVCDLSQNSLTVSLWQQQQT